MTRWIVALLALIAAPALATDPVGLSNEMFVQFRVKDAATTPNDGCVQAFTANAVLAGTGCDDAADSNFTRYVIPVDPAKTYRFTDMTCMKMQGEVAAGEDFTVTAATFTQGSGWTNNTGYALTFDGDDADKSDPGDHQTITEENVADAAADFSGPQFWGLQFEVGTSGSTPDWDVQCVLGVRDIF
jgi:hypothetical protein